MRNQLSILVAFLFFALASCTPKSVVTTKVVEKQIIENGGKEILINEVNQSILEEEPFNSWYTSGYSSYQPKPEVIKQLSKSINKYNLELFFGSWCGDSKRGVPRIYKVLDQAGYDLNKLTTTAVGRRGALYKKSTDGATDGKDIKRVPTLIVFNKAGEEIGRIIENPKATFEEDLLEIISSK